MIGADGLHSIVRKLVFGDESQFSHDLGMYISIFSVPNYLKLDRWEIEYSRGGKLVNLYSAQGDTEARAAFLFASKNLGIDPRDIIQQKALLGSIYADIGWEVPRLLKAMENTTDFYFDSVTQICMDHWSKGRVALIGDAGYCASPVSGQGTSLALVGAYVLAGELAAAHGDYKKAFLAYEQNLRRYVRENQKLGKIFAKNLTDRKHTPFGWLKEQCMKLLPNQWIHFITTRSLRRVSRAARSIALRNYTP